MNDIEIAQAVSTILSKFTKATPDEAPATSEAARVDGLDEIVAKALAQHSSVRDASAISQVAKVANASTGAFDTMDEAISAAVLAQVQYRHCSMQDRASFINGIRDVFLQEDVLCALSRMAVEETGMGNYEDKLIKNRVAALKTPG
ncbi:propanediol utilization system aldehyde dehydrogenase GrpJ, partial [Escherichia coli]|nr:propanediol utilization system aldehyde dehydrogenase GrpJ [Escherichia coli]